MTIRAPDGNTMIGVEDPAPITRVADALMLCAMHVTGLLYRQHVIVTYRDQTIQSPLVAARA